MALTNLHLVLHLLTYQDSNKEEKCILWEYKVDIKASIANFVCL